MNSSKRQVVVTGIGAVSPLGLNVSENWQSLIDGKKVANTITQFEASSWPIRIACEVNDFQLSEEARLDSQAHLLNRPVEFGMQAAYEAVLDSKLTDLENPDRVGVSIGAGIGAVSPHTLAKMLKGIEEEHISNKEFKISDLLEESSAADERVVLKNHPGILAALLSARWQAQGPVNTIHTACASSGQSVGLAYRQIEQGLADVMIAGGADSLAGEFLLAGFCLLGALSKRNDDPTTASRPFDRDRDGFVAGEGAGILILEEKKHALARSAKIYAELSGYGETSSAYRITDLPADGRGVVESMQLALADANITAQDVGYINAHGTSTELNDRIEAAAIRRVFYEQGARPAISSTKATTGHLISAAGGLELVFCVKSLTTNMLPPNTNLFSTDCGDDLAFVGREAERRELIATLSNSVGFGGSNASVILTKGDKND